MKCKIKNIYINYEIIGNGKPIIMMHGISSRPQINDRMYGTCI